MGNIVTNRIRIEISDTPEVTLRRTLPIISPASADDVMSLLAAKGRAEASFDPLIAMPIPEALKAIPEVLPDRINLALAASSRFDLVQARSRLLDPMLDQLPDWMRPANRRQVIEESRHATKSPEELLTWANANIPEEMRLAHLMKIAYRDTQHMEARTWFRDVLGTRGMADSLGIEVANDVVLIGFDTVNSAPAGWFSALATSMPEARFTTWSWDEDTDYSLIGVASGDGKFVSAESDEPNDIRRAKAGAKGLMGKAEPDWDEDTDWDIEDGPAI